MRKMQRNLFQTGLDQADPAIDITFERWNYETEKMEFLSPQRVLVRFRHDKKLIRVYGGLTSSLASSPTDMDGMFSAFEPFDVQTGDRFSFQGLSGRIGEVWPPRNGRRRASFTVEGDKRKGPPS